MYCLLCHCTGRSICYKTNYRGEPQLEIGEFGQAPGQFNEPSGITTDGDVILVADSRNDRIQVSCSTVQPAYLHRCHSDKLCALIRSMLINGNMQMSNLIGL